MYGRTLTPSTPDATSGWRQDPRLRRPARPAGKLDLLSKEVLGRFLDEGVPEADVLYVAAETHRCIRAIEAGEELPENVHFWTNEILARYEEKAATLFFTLAGGRTVRI